MSEVNIIDTYLEPKVKKIITDTISWYENQVQQINEVIDSRDDLKIFSGDGFEKSLTTEESHIFRAGMATVLDLFGDFPLQIKPINPDDDDSEVQV